MPKKNQWEKLRKLSGYHLKVLKTSITKEVFFVPYNIADFIWVCISAFFQDKGTLVIAVAIGPDSTRPGSQRVLEQIAGDNVVYVDDYQSLNGAIDEIFNLICCMYQTTISRYSISALNVPVAYGK